LLEDLQSNGTDNLISHLI